MTRMSRAMFYNSAKEDLDLDPMTTDVANLKGRQFLGCRPSRSKPQRSASYPTAWFEFTAQLQTSARDHRNQVPLTHTGETTAAGRRAVMSTDTKPCATCGASSKQYMLTQVISIVLFVIEMLRHTLR